MMTGLYADAAALDVFQRRHEATTANLANLATPGYRRRVEVLESRRLPQRPGRARRGGRPLTVPRFRIGLDFRPGELRSTGNDLDLALVGVEPGDGNAFFAVGTDRGERYTRNGRLAVDGEGRLVHAVSGFPVLGRNGVPITLNPAKGRPVVDERGAVLQDGRVVGRLKLVRFDRLDRLSPVPHGLLAAPPEAAPEDATGRVKVRQGYLEGSNAEPVEEMVDMIANFRAYEAAQRVLRQMDASMERLLQQTA